MRDWGDRERGHGGRALSAENRALPGNQNPSTPVQIPGWRGWWWGKRAARRAAVHLVYSSECVCEGICPIDRFSVSMPTVWPRK